MRTQLFALVLATSFAAVAGAQQIPKTNQQIRKPAVTKPVTVALPVTFANGFLMSYQGGAWSKSLQITINCTTPNATSPCAGWGSLVLQANFPAVSGGASKYLITHLPAQSTFPPPGCPGGYNLPQPPNGSQSIALNPSQVSSYPFTCKFAVEAFTNAGAAVWSDTVTVTVSYTR